MTPEKQTSCSALTDTRCNCCASFKIRRSHREGLFELLLSFAGRYPFCCHECKHRFFLKRESIAASPAAEIFTPAGHDRPIERRREEKKIEARRRRRVIVIVAVCLLIFLMFVKYYVLIPPPIVMPD